jgi:hypothetical protein
VGRKRLMENGGDWWKKNEIDGDWWKRMEIGED